MHASLTRRYLLALGIVALVLVFSYAASRQFDADALRYARLINVSGQQRMLSQRISLLALRVQASPTSASDELIGALDTAIRTLRRNQLELRTDWDEGVLHHDSPQDPWLSRLDARVSGYLARASTLLDTGAPARVADALFEEASSDFLSQLDAVVTRYQHVAERSVRAALWRERAQLALGLSVLLAEMLLIFRPMVHSTVRSLQRLSRSNGQLRDVGHRLAHDLRAPLASSLGLVALAQESLDDGDVAEARFAIGRVVRSLEALDVSIGAMNESLRNPHLLPAPEPVDVASLIDEAISVLSHMSGAAGIDIRKDVPEGLSLTSERRALGSILENLVSNAIKYADPSTGAPTVSIRARRRRCTVEIDVVDNGLGIPPANRDRLFERFERCHPERATGTGLGLFLVRQAAERLSGSVDYTPLADGSRFRVRVPDLRSAILDEPEPQAA